jgi:fatty-acyl-CoA synthase
VTIASRTSFDESELRGFCEARLARIKVPTRFVVIDEFPRTETGKIKKRELRVTPAAAAS